MVKDNFSARILKVVVILFLWAGITLAQDNTPKYSNEFLNLGVGGRGMAMANTQAGISRDVQSGYWNPAGLTYIDSKYQGSLMHASYFAGIANYDYAGFAMPLDTLSSLGATIMRFAVDDIPDTRFLYDANGAVNYDNIRFFTAADYAFLISYGRRLPDLKDLRIGGNIKIIHRKVGEFASAWGFGIDAGAQFRIEKWQLGVMFRDVFGTFNAWSHNSELVSLVYTQTGNLIPENSVEITLPKLIMGVGYQFRISENFGVLPALDLDLTFDGARNVILSSDVVSIDPHFGFEVDYRQIAFLRGGISGVQEIKDFDGSTYWTFQPGFGLGVNIKSLSIDYAFLDIGDQSESLYSHVFSIQVSID